MLESLGIRSLYYTLLLLAIPLLLARLGWLLLAEPGRTSNRPEEE